MSETPTDPGRPSLGPFLLQTAQLLALLTALYVWRVAEPFGFDRLLPLIAIGFVINAWLPGRLRPAFFLLVSVVGAPLVLGWAAAAAVLGLGVALVGIAQLPLAWPLRVGIAVLAGGALAWLRARDAGPIFTLALPVLGSMFMFRLPVYLHARRHERTKPRTFDRFSYFFMLPNLVFLLFPVVDFKTWTRSFRGGDAVETRQRGLQLLSRGLLHVVLYRAIYHYVVPDVTDVTDLGQLALFMMSTYALYLRISGQFHLILGIVALFGYDLPDTHRHYFAATGFDDLWRRINIYWRDFLTKVVYYPVYFRLRKTRGQENGMLLSVGAVFVATWLLHSYQWFWLKGTFPLTAVDMVFWTFFAGLVAVSALWELRTERPDTPRIQSIWRDAGKSVATFAGMCVLWSFISSPTIADWLHLVAVARYASAADVAWIAGTGAVLYGLFATVHRLDGRGLRKEPPTAVIVAGVFGLAGLALVSVVPQVQAVLPAAVVGVVDDLRKDRLSDRDREQMERGYYESVLSMDRYLATLWKKQLRAPAGWNERTIVENSDDGFSWELKPDLDIEFKRARITTNSFAMRDLEYTRQKPEGAWRVALMGGSGTMGSGVADGLNFESVVETRLNAEDPYGVGTYEILNFSVPGHDLLRRLWQVEQRVFDFEPDAIILVSMAHRDAQKLVHHLVSATVRDLVIPFEPARRVQQQTGVTSDMPRSELMRRLKPHGTALVRAAYERLAMLCRERGVTPVWLFVPVPGDVPDHASIPEFAQMARDAGMVTLSLAGTLEHLPPQDLAIAPWDLHPNATAHDLLAQRLFEELRAQADALGLTGRRR